MDAVTKTSSEADDTDSPSSVLGEAAMSDSQEQLILSENTKTEGVNDEEERKLRRFNRRKALALQRCAIPAPKLGRVLASANNTIDLTNEDDDPNNQWFKRTFNATKISKKQSPEEDKKFAIPRTISKNAPKSLLVQETLKKKLQASMSAKRKKEQLQRRKMYEEDNEHLKPPSDEEEEEEIIRKKKKTKNPKSMALDAEYNSDDDEDYKEEDSPPENSSGEEEEDNGAGGNNGRADDEMSVNLLNDSFTYDVFNNVKRPGPGSTVSNFDLRSQNGDNDSNDVEQLPTMTQIAGSADEFGEVLNIGAGSFGASQCDFEGGFPDTLQMLLDEGKSSKPKHFTPIEETVEEKNKNEEIEEDDDDDAFMKKLVKSKRTIDSDDEDEVVEETPEEGSEVVQSLDLFASSEENEAESGKKVESNQLRRVVLSGDEDSEEEEDDDDAENNEDEEEGEEEEEVVEEDPANEEEPEEEPNFDDEDDELAVIKRLEHQEYKQKMRKGTLFDDEASLSGDDVGSEDEDDDGNDAYEAEEGDADELPDDDTIRRQNYKLLLKQESDKEQRALAKLQDRLLADGDLGGVETNRQFRFKLREEIDVQIAECAEEDNDQEEDEPEETEEEKKKRAEMIKYKIEHAGEFLLLDEQKGDDDDMFNRVGKIMKVSEKVVVESSEEIVIKSRIGKPSLLSKTALANSFQEVLSGGSAAPKQMYVQKQTPSSDSSTSIPAPAPRQSMGAVKRGSTTPNPSSVKRARSSKLSSLE